MIRYLTLAEVVAIHAAQLNAHGGSTGVRDPGLLEVALYRPQTGYYSDVIQQAAALWESLSQNHPFVDGNKRTALACADVFLRLNGLKISASPDSLYEWLSGLYSSGNLAFNELDAWLRTHTVSRENPEK